MSDEETSPEDKTEEPSQRRLDDARKEGRVPLSKDLVAGVAVVVGAALVVSRIGGVVGGGVDALVAVTARMADVDARAAVQAPLSEAVLAACRPLWEPGVFVVVAVAAVALVVTLVQTQGGFWIDQAMPDAKKAWSPKRVVHAFSRQGLADMGLAVVKALAIGVVALDAARDHLPALQQALQASTASSTTALGGALADIAVRSAVVLGVAGAVDFVMVRRRSLGELRMTKDELKREAKEDEGDPHIRAARRRRHRDLKRGSIHKEVPRADAVVVNPTHIAVALRYRKGSDKAPRVVAKGSGAKAAAMRALAVEHGVPIVKDVPLARLLHKRVRIGREVPADTYRAVAAVLAFVAKVTGRAPGTGPEN